MEADKSAIPMTETTTLEALSGVNLATIAENDSATDDLFSMDPGKTERRRHRPPLRSVSSDTSSVDGQDVGITLQRNRDRASQDTARDLQFFTERIAHRDSVNPAGDGDQSHPSPPDVDRGWAWVILASLFLWNFLMTGTVKLIGILYVEFLELFQAGTVTTSWLGFTFSLCVVLSSPVGGHLKDSLHFHQLRILLLVTYSLTCVGVAAAGWMPVFTGAIVSMGLVGGLSAGLSGPATFSLLGVYFHKRRGLASTLAFCGTTVSSLALPPLITVLVETYSMRGAMLIYAALGLNALMVPAAVSSSDKVEEYSAAADRFEAEQQEAEVHKLRRTKTPVHGSELRLHRINTRRASLWSKASRPQITETTASDVNLRKRSVKSFLRQFLLEYSFLKTGKAWLMTFILFCGLYGFYNTFFVLPPLAAELSMTKLEGSLLVALPSVTELIFRPVFGILIDKGYVSKMRVLTCCYLFSGAATLVVSLLEEPNTYLGFALVFGISGGMAVPLGLPIFMDLVPEEHYGGIGGWFLILIGLSSSVGSPTLSAIAQHSGTFLNSLRTCGAVFLCGFIACAATDLANTLADYRRSRKIYPLIL